MDEKQLKKDIDKFKKELADGINELALHHPELTWIGINIRPMNKARLEVIRILLTCVLRGKEGRVEWI